LALPAGRDRLAIWGRNSAEDQERLAGMLYNTLRAELEKYFVLASGPPAVAYRAARARRMASP